MTRGGEGPDTGFPDPRVPVPPEPAPVQVLRGYCPALLPQAGTSPSTGPGLPLVGPDPLGNDGYRCVSFLHRDAPGAPSGAVILSANALVDHRRPEVTEFERVSGVEGTCGLWALTLRMPHDWQASYRITAVPAGSPVPWRAVGDRRTVRLAADAGGVDPGNPLQGSAMDGSPTSIVRLPGAAAPDWLAVPTPGRTLPHPGLEEIVVRDSLAGRNRRVWVYAPPTAAPPNPAAAGKALPMVLLHDGQVWAKYQNLPATLDAAISAGALPSLYMALIDSVDVPTRSRELSGPVGTVDFVARDLLPVLRGRLPISGHAADTVVSGASYGGLASLWQLARYPQLVGNALAQSPSLWRYDLTDYLLAVKKQVRIRLQAGTYESTVHSPTLALASALETGGADVAFRSVTGGHDWAWWAPWLVRGLAQLLLPQPGHRP